MIELQVANMNRALFQISKVGIELIGVSRISYTRLRAKVSRQNLKRLRQILGDGAKIQVLYKGGSWKLLHLAKQHIAVLAVFFAVVAVMIYMSGCCLRIGISGNETISKDAIYEIAMQNGAALFSRKAKSVPIQIEKALWDNFPELRYVYVTYEGTTLQITVREKYLTPPIQSTEPCAVYAAQDGVITKITVYSGKAMVEEGDRVRKGDLLIAGSYYIGQQAFCVHAAGRVEAKVDAVSTVLIPKTAMQIWQPTGQSTQGRILQLGRRIILLEGQDPYKKSKVSYTPLAEAGENSPLYMQIKQVTWQELQPVYTEAQKRAAVQAQRELSRDALYRSLGATGQVLDLETYEQETERGLQVTFTLRVSMELGQQGEVNAAQPPQTETIP